MRYFLYIKEEIIAKQAGRHNIANVLAAIASEVEVL
jgi:UDP-N-acetylmuramyl pentapeptide synthase